MRDYCDQVIPYNSQQQESNGSISTQDLEEYLVDMNHGMELEGSMAETGMSINNGRQEQDTLQ